MKKSQRIINFIETYCKAPDGYNRGKTIKLLDFQKKFIKDIYDNPNITSEAYLSIGRKNGKTALISCLILAHLCVPTVALSGSQIISGARSREQASIVFDYAKKIVNQSEELSTILSIIPSKKEIHNIRHDITFKAIASEAKTTQGLSPVLAILDEVGQVERDSDDFIDAITTSQGAHENKLLIAISTQAPSDGSLFSVWLDNAHLNKKIVSHVYAADTDLEIDNPKAWKQSNPALGIFRSEQDIKDQVFKARQSPSAENSFRNLILNQRVSTESPFISKDTWKSIETKTQNADEFVWYGGLDLSMRNDLTAFVMLGVKDDEFYTESHYWIPNNKLKERVKKDKAPYDIWEKQGYLTACSGSGVDYEEVIDYIHEQHTKRQFISIAYDRWNIDTFKSMIQYKQLELPLVEYGQGFKSISPALMNLEIAINDKKLKHDGNPVLTMCMNNARIDMDKAGNRKFIKKANSKRIDGAVALTMVMGIASNNAEHTPSSSDWDSYFKSFN